MSSGGSVDDVDLIDLDSGVAPSCVARVSVPDATPEEQEHLLDVCPPKLEQKLSLTRRSQQELSGRGGCERDAAGNVLVTLGHDQVVPVRRRIDVVSSDTIKRVRDITKNLEPVIRPGERLGEDRVDAVEDEASYEARQINDAFNFLAELDDNEEQHQQVVAYPLEPACRVKEPGGYVFENKAYEASPPAKATEAEERKRGFEFDGLKAARSSFKRLRSFTCSAVGFDVEPPCPVRKRPKGCVYRKSWSAGSSARRSRRVPDAVARRKRTCSERAGDCKNDGQVKLTRRGQSESSIGPSQSASDSSHTCSSTSSCSSSSSCSEVDWSWVEEVEPDWGRQPHQHLGRESARRTEDQQQQQAEPDAAASAEAAADELRRRRCDSPTSGGGSGARMRDKRSAGCESDASVAMSVAAAGKAATTAVATAAARDSSDALPRIEHLLRTGDAPSLADDEAQCNQDDARSNRNESSTGTLPWLRASMRRLRQLRFPETVASSCLGDSSGPNSLPDIALIAPEILAAQTNDTTGGLLRPSSAPAPARATAPAITAAGATATSTSASTASTTAASSPRRGRRCQARNPPPRQPPATARSASSAESTSTCASSAGPGSSSASSTSSATNSPQHQPNTTTSPRRLCDRQRDGDRDDERGDDDDEDENPLGRWPHALSPALACLGCTLGLFNISRFAILSIQFGANFIIQFLILSLLIGIPLLTLQVCLGQRLAAGAVDMWKISPLFQGVGIALLTAQAFIGIYSIVGVSWMFVYFRDSFITKQDRYRWAEPFALYREDVRPTASSAGGGASPSNGNGSAYKLHETVADYFSGAVLQRHHLSEPDPGVVTLKFQVAFNLAVVWMIVFVSLSKGLRSYGKVVYVFTLVPIFGTLVLCTKLLGLTPPGTIHQLFPSTVWSEFFINGRCWIAASTEVFLTWGLLGAAAMQIAAHNKHKHLLQRDCSLVIVLTLVVLLLSAFLANTCVQILKYHGYVYMTSSFEKISAYIFMRPYNQAVPPGYNTPERFMAHSSFLVGERATRPGIDHSYESGYQVLRLASELVPATFAVLGTEQVSPFWAILFYFILILFGIAQQLAIWHCVITGIMAINTKMMKLWETTITFFSCACAYILGLPMATELGIYVVYYLDYTVGGAWWITVLYLVQVGAVFAVRGRPHTGEAVVAELFPPTGTCLRYWAGPLLSFTWNVVLPITLMVISITTFKSGGYRELYTYRRSSKDYWAIWARQLGASIQLIPLLIIPVVAVIQTCRYLNNGPPDIFDRIQLLYRPSLEPEEHRGGQTSLGAAGATSLHGNGMVTSTTELPFEDPPPKYTPPPSYTTATGARIAKMLRQSFRRSVRRIANVLGEGASAAAARHRPALQQQQPPPPDYAAVLVEMNQSVSSRDVAIHIAEIQPDIADTRRSAARMDRHRPNTIDRSMCRRGISTIERPTMHRGHYTVDRSAGRRPYNNSNPQSQGSMSTLTAAEVANLLRSSIRRPQTLRRSFHQHHQHQHPAPRREAGAPEQQTAASVENLVEAAAPIGSSAPQPPLVPPASNDDRPRQPDKTADELESSPVSVI